MQKYTCLLLLLAFLFLPAVVSAHDYHASFAEMRYNSKTRTFELALKVFTHDLELALTDKAGYKVKLAKTEKVHDLVEKYLKNHIVLASKKGGHLPVKLLRFEEEKDATWIYAEFDAGAAPPSQIVLYNGVFMKLFPDQMNILNLDLDGKKHSFLFRKGAESQQFEIY